LRWHPDQNPDDPAAEEKFKRIVNAYEELKARKDSHYHHPRVRHPNNPSHHTAESESIHKRDQKHKDNFKDFIDNKEEFFANYQNAWEKQEEERETANAHRKVRIPSITVHW
jgi:DnaJ-class molecular chaperone